MKLSINLIRTDGGTQLRAASSAATISEYAAELARGATFPPIIVFHDGKTYWLGDGYHRLEARQKAGSKEIEADVRQGTQRDAILHAVGANAEHGLRRTTEDKKNAVLALLRDPEWRKWSDRQIGERARVDGKTVAKYRRELNGGEFPGSGNPDDSKGAEFRTASGPPSCGQTPREAEGTDASASVSAAFLDKVPIADMVAAAARRGELIQMAELIAECDQPEEAVDHQQIIELADQMLERLLDEEAADD